ncbi:MAG: DUF481 domain-containing protein [Phenylobacterium sp.]|nr:MAG: DUF481 domain-containing protein [Phenylobacterium sp.]
MRPRRPSLDRGRRLRWAVRGLMQAMSGIHWPSARGRLGGLATWARRAMSGPRRPWTGRAIWSGVVVGILLSFILAGSSSAAPLEPGIQAMIETAYRGGDAATVAAVLDVARKTAPDSLAEIQALESRYEHQAALVRAERLQAVRDRLAQTGARSLWSGDLELGGSQFTGGLEGFDLYAGAKATRDSLHWTQKFSGRVDYGETDNTKTKEQVDASYEPELKLDQGLFAYGAAAYAHDRFLGYRHRITASVGLGVTALDQSGLNVVVEVGSAVRYARYYTRPSEDRLGAQATVAARWTVRPNLTISEDATVYADHHHTTARSTLSLATRLFGPLEARLAYDYQFEDDGTPEGRKGDSETRATLAYSF